MRKARKSARSTACISKSEINKRSRARRFADIEEDKQLPRWNLTLRMTGQNVNIAFDTNCTLDFDSHAGNL